MNPVYHDAIQDGVEYERSLFSPEHRNWLDLRKRPASTPEENDKEEPARNTWTQVLKTAMGVIGRSKDSSLLDRETVRARLTHPADLVCTRPRSAGRLVVFTIAQTSLWLRLGRRCV